MNHSLPHIPFEGFLVLLRSKGFAIGTDTLLHMQLLFKQVDGPVEPARYKQLFAPLIVKNESEQAEFYALFDEYFQLNPLPGAGAGGGRSPETGTKELPARPWYARRRFFVPLATTFIFGVMAWLFIQSRPGEGYQPGSEHAIDSLLTNWLVGTSGGSSGTGKPPELTGNGDTNGLTDSGNQDAADRNNSFPMPQSNRPDYVPPDSALISQIPSVAPEPAPRSLFLDQNLFQGREFKTRLSFFERYVRTAFWPLIFLPLLIFGVWSLFRIVRTRTTLYRDHVPDPPYKFELEVPQPEQGLFPQGEAADLGKALARRETRDRLELDIRSTIRAAIRKAGFPSLIYRPQEEAPEYLILVEQLGAGDHYQGMVNELISELTKTGLLARIYYFSQDPRGMVDEYGHPISLDTLANRYPHSRMVLFSDGKALADPGTGGFASWSSIFLRWPQRAILTPIPAGDWKLHEWSLQKQFLLAESSLQGIEWILGAFYTEVEPSTVPFRGAVSGSGQAETLIDKYPPALRRLPKDFSHPPTCVKIDHALQEWLGPGGYRLLVACAVYPELNWSLTRHFYQKLDNQFREKGYWGAYSLPVLRKLVMLPWFRKGKLPHALRALMVGNLEQEPEGRNFVRWVRKEIVRLLETSSRPAVHTMAGQEYRMMLYSQQLALNANDRPAKKGMKDLLEFLPEKTIQQDAVVLRTLEGVQPNGLGILLPKRVRKSFFRTGIPIRGAKIKSAMLLSFVGVAFFSILALVAFNFMTDPWEKVSFQDKTVFVKNPVERAWFFLQEGNAAYRKGDFVVAEEAFEEAMEIAEFVEPASFEDSGIQVNADGTYIRGALPEGNISALTRQLYGIWFRNYAALSDLVKDETLDWGSILQSLNGAFLEEGNPDALTAHELRYVEEAQPGSYSSAPKDDVPLTVIVSQEDLYGIMGLLMYGWSYEMRALSQIRQGDSTAFQTIRQIDSTWRTGWEWFNALLITDDLNAQISQLGSDSLPFTRYYLHRQFDMGDPNFRNGQGAGDLMSFYLSLSMGLHLRMALEDSAAIPQGGFPTMDALGLIMDSDSAYFLKHQSETPLPFLVAQCRERFYDATIPFGIDFQADSAFFRPQKKGADFPVGYKYYDEVLKLMFNHELPEPDTPAVDFLEGLVIDIYYLNGGDDQAQAEQIGEYLRQRLDNTEIRVRGRSRNTYRDLFTNPRNYQLRYKAGQEDSAALALLGLLNAGAREGVPSFGLQTVGTATDGLLSLVIPVTSENPDVNTNGNEDAYLAFRPVLSPNLFDDAALRSNRDQGAEFHEDISFSFDPTQNFTGLSEETTSRDWAAILNKIQYQHFLQEKVSIVVNYYREIVGTRTKEIYNRVSEISEWVKAQFRRNYVALAEPAVSLRELNPATDLRYFLNLNFSQNVTNAVIDLLESGLAGEELREQLSGLLANEGYNHLLKQLYYVDIAFDVSYDGAGELLGAIVKGDNLVPYRILWKEYAYLILAYEDVDWAASKIDDAFKGSFTREYEICTYLRTNERKALDDFSRNPNAANRERVRAAIGQLESMDRNYAAWGAFKNDLGCAYAITGQLDAARKQFKAAGTDQANVNLKRLDEL